MAVSSMSLAARISVATSVSASDGCDEPIEEWCMLSDDELLRYSRQILLRQVDIEGQLKLKQSRVLIVGLGGLGSPVALYLAAAGVGELHLADFDQLDLTNLQRQIAHDTPSVGLHKVDSAMARLSALNPLVKLVPHRAAMDADTLGAAVAGVDLVLDCTDNFAVREAVNAACVAAVKPLVSGAAIRLEGQLSVFDPRVESSPCYHCLYGHGTEAELTCSEAGVLGPVVGMVGSLQALEAIKLLVGFGEPLIGRLLLVDALSSRFRELKVKRDPACAVCGSGRV
jgi:adenylyltransferase/sulfurtransferase